MIAQRNIVFRYTSIRYIWKASGQKGKIKFWQLFRRAKKLSHFLSDENFWMKFERSAVVYLRYIIKFSDHSELIQRTCGPLNYSGSYQEMVLPAKRGYRVDREYILFLLTMWHVWEHVCYYIDPKFTEFLFVFCYFGIGSVYLYFTRLTLSMLSIKNRKKGGKANVSSTYGGPIQCHKLKD